MKDVSYNGQPIYIQHVKENQTARIFAMDDPENEFNVQLASLFEKLK